MLKRKSPPPNPISCVEFRQLVSGRSDIQTIRRERELCHHEKTCLLCNLWLVDQLEALDLAMLDGEDKRRRKSGLHAANKNIKRLQKKAEERLLQSNILDNLSDPEPESKVG